MRRPWLPGACALATAITLVGCDSDRNSTSDREPPHANDTGGGPWATGNPNMPPNRLGVRKPSSGTTGLEENQEGTELSAVGGTSATGTRSGGEPLFQPDDTADVGNDPDSEGPDSRVSNDVDPSRPGGPDPGLPNIGIFGAGGPCPATSEAYVADPFYESFDGEIDTDVWLVATWIEHGGQTGPERCFTKDGHLNMRFVNDPSVPEHYLSSAIETRREFYFGRWEARLKPSHVPGVLNSMYTIDWNDTSIGGSGTGTKQEIDIEFLTHSFGGSEGEVHLAVHAEGEETWDTYPDVSLGFDPSDSFHVFGFEITPQHVAWFVDDQILFTYRYAEHDVAINSPYALKFNVWSQEKWINGPPEPGVESTYLIDWVRFTPYPCTSDQQLR